MNFDLINKLFSEKTKEADLRVKKDIINSLKLHFSNKEDSSYKRKLVDSYWKLIKYLVLNSVPKDIKEPLNFTKEAELIINFGFLSDNLILDEKIDINSYFDINLDSFVELEIETLSLSSFFQRRYFEFIKASGHDLLKEKLDNIKEEYGRETIRLLILENERMEQLEELIKKSKIFINLKHINKVLSENLKKLNYKKIYYGRGSLSNELERNEIINLEESIKRSSQEREKIYKMEEFNSRGISKKIKDIDKYIEEKIKRVEEIKVEKNKVSNDYLNISFEEEDISVEKIQAYLDESLKKVQIISRIVVKKENEDLSPCLTTNVKEDIVETLDRIVRKLRKKDIDIFKNCKVEYNRKPYIVFIPGFGNSYYHDRFNSIFLPLNSNSGLEHSILTSFGLYKWKMDDIDYIKKRYIKLERNAILTKSSLEEKFSEEYYCYISQAIDKTISNDSLDWFRNILCRSEKFEELKLNYESNLIEKESTHEEPMFNLRKKNFLRKLNSMLKIKDIDSLIEISLTEENNSLIDIKIKGIDPTKNDKIEKIFDALLMQSKLKRFSELNIGGEK